MTELKRNPQLSPDSDMLAQLRKEYTQGTRVQLIEEMDDPDSPPAGTKGTVLYVDGLGTVFVKWDTGIILGAIWECDWIDKLNN